MIVIDYLELLQPVVLVYSRLFFQRLFINVHLMSDFVLFFFISYKYIK